MFVAVVDQSLKPSLLPAKWGPRQSIVDCNVDEGSNLSTG